MSKKIITKFKVIWCNLSNVLILVFSLNNLLDVLLVILSYFIPKDKKLLLFTAHHGDLYKGNSKFLFNYIKNNYPEYRCVFSTNNKSLYDRLNNSKINVSYTYSLKHIFLVLRAKYLFIDFSNRGLFFRGTSVFLGRFNIIQLWHGTGFKNIVLINEKATKLKNFVDKKNCSLYKLVVATSEKDQEQKIKAFYNKNVFITGSPRNDVFFNENLRENNYKKELKLEKYNKIITYVPTFRESQFIEPFTKEFLMNLNKYLKENNQIFLVKKHPLDKMLKIPKAFSNIIDVTSKVADIQELLLDTDLLITDYSGTVTDYVLTNRPVIFYMYDYDNYLKKSRSLYYDIEKIYPGAFAYKEEQLLKLIKNKGWSKTAKYKRDYEKFKKMFNKYEDGDSSKRVAEIILKGLKNG